MNNSFQVEVETTVGFEVGHLIELDDGYTVYFVCEIEDATHLRLKNIMPASLTIH